MCIYSFDIKLCDARDPVSVDLIIRFKCQRILLGSIDVLRNRSVFLNNSEYSTGPSSSTSIVKKDTVFGVFWGFFSPFCLQFFFQNQAEMETADRALCSVSILCCGHLSVNLQ